MDTAKKRYAEDLQDRVNVLLGKISEAKLLVREAKENGCYAFVKLEIEALVKGLTDLGYQATEDPRFIAIMEALLKETDEGKETISACKSCEFCMTNSAFQIGNVTIERAFPLGKAVFLFFRKGQDMAIQLLGESKDAFCFVLEGNASYDTAVREAILVAKAWGAGYAQCAMDVQKEGF